MGFFDFLTGKSQRKAKKQLFSKEEGFRKALIDELQKALQPGPGSLAESTFQRLFGGDIAGLTARGLGSSSGLVQKGIQRNIQAESPLRIALAKAKGGLLSPGGPSLGLLAQQAAAPNFGPALFGQILGAGASSLGGLFEGAGQQQGFGAQQFNPSFFQGGGFNRPPSGFLPGFNEAAKFTGGRQ